jgi:hypothetical protein
MSLASGTKIEPKEIQPALGAGGIGQVTARGTPGSTAMSRSSFELKSGPGLTTRFERKAIVSRGVGENVRRGGGILAEFKEMVPGTRERQTRGPWVLFAILS